MVFVYYCYYWRNDDGKNIVTIVKTVKHQMKLFCSFYPAAMCELSFVFCKNRDFDGNMLWWYGRKKTVWMICFDLTLCVLCVLCLSNQALFLLFFCSWFCYSVFKIPLLASFNNYVNLKQGQTSFSRLSCPLLFTPLWFKHGLMAWRRERFRTDISNVTTC